MSATLPRVLGLRHTVVIVIGAIIGVGIFFTPSQVARYAGSADRALFLWTLAGASAACGGVVFGELGRRFPRAGGQYRVVREAWGAFPAFVYVVCLLTAVQAGAAAVIAWIAARNLGVALGVELTQAAETSIALAMIAGVTVTNVLGVRQGTGVQTVTVAAKLVTLAGIVLIAAMLGAAPPAAAATGGGTSGGAAAAVGIGWLAGLLPAMFSYGGWQHALWMAGEVKEPERNVPRGIGIGVAVVVVAYVSAAWAYFALLGYDGVVGAKALAAEAVGTVMPGTGARVVAGAVGISAYGVLNAQFLAGPRQVWALASDGLFFRPLASLHATRATPVGAILALAACATTVLLVAGADGVGPLTAWTVVVDTVFFGLTAAALLKIHRAEGRFTGATLCAVLFLGLEVVALAAVLTSPEVRAAGITGIVWVLLVAGVYAVGFRGRAPA